MPPLPPNFVPRPEALSALRKRLLQDPGPQSANIALTAVQGMGGIGKTVLAQALCHDSEVMAAFSDGIIWQSVGKESTIDLVTRMREVGKVLNDDLTGYENELACKNQYRSTMRNKAALLVIDDVWRVNDIEPWLAESARSRVLFTTRNASIADSVSAQQHWAELLSWEQSREMFARWAGVEKRKLSRLAEEIIGECQQLPLALSMVGAMLKGKHGDVWEHTLQLLQTADLEKIKGQFPNYPHPSLF